MRPGMAMELTPTGYLIAADTPSQTTAELALFINLLRSNLPRIRGCLVFAGGPGPNPAQRAELQALFPNFNAIPLTSIVTESGVNRGIVTAMNWFGFRRMRAFEPSETMQAILHINPTRDCVGELAFRSNRLLHDIHSRIRLPI